MRQDFFFVNLNFQRSTITLTTVGIKYSMRDPIRDDDYCALSATLHYASRRVADVSDPFLHQWGDTVYNHWY